LKRKELRLLTPIQPSKNGRIRWVISHPKRPILPKGRRKEPYLKTQVGMEELKELPCERIWGQFQKS